MGYNYADAQRVLTGVLTEGEGVRGSLYETNPFNGREEHSHYHRFNQVAHNRYYQPYDIDGKDPTGPSMGTDWTAVYNFAPNPKAADYRSQPEIYRQMLEFNSCYTRLLASLHNVFNGSPELFGEQVANMMVLSKLASELMAVPAPGKPGMTVGPPWEWLDI